MSPNLENRDILDEEGLSFELERLFDPSNMDHLPEEQHLDGFKKTNLLKHKYYKAAVQFSGMNPVRRRVMICPPMTNEDGKNVFKGTKIIETSLPIMKSFLVGTNVRLKSAKVKTEKIIPTEEEWKMRLKERMTLRKNLDEAVDCFVWLKNKPQKSSLELKHLKRCQIKKMCDEFFVQPESQECRSTYNYFLGKLSSKDPFVAEESIGLHILDEYLLKNDHDLSNFFVLFNRQKKGLLSWKRFIKVFKKNKTPLVTYEIMQAAVVLDCVHDNKIDYHIFCERMAKFREYKWTRLMSFIPESSSNTTDSTGLQQGQSILQLIGVKARISDETIQNSNKTSMTEMSMPLAAELQPYLNPKLKYLNSGYGRNFTNLDICPERALRFIDRSTYEAHLKPCSLPERMAKISDHFCKARLKEYVLCMELCEQNGVILSADLAAKVLLSTNDLPSEVMEQNVNPTKNQVNLQMFLARVSHESSQMSKTSKYGALNHVSQHGRIRSHSLTTHQPYCSTVYPRPSLMNLSTGTAKISSKINSRLTFSEFQELICRCTKYIPLKDQSKMQTVWPGYLLDKLRLCFSPGDKGDTSDRHHPLFEIVVKDRGQI